MILIAVPKRLELYSEPVEHLVRQAKSFRADSGESVDSLPIVRLSSSVESHGNVLRELGLRKLADPVVYLCRRGPRGWPVSLLKPLSLREFLVEQTEVAPPTEKTSPSPPKDKVSAPRREPTDPPPTHERGLPNSVGPDDGSTLEIGYLLYYQTRDPEASAQVKALVKELGRFWLERYGRANPAPFPLAFYDASNPQVKARVGSRWPEIGDGEKPVLYLASYQGKRPEKILASVHDLDLPAQAIRSAASLRKSWQNKVQLTSSPSSSQNSPLPEPVSLDDSEETFLLVLRIRELAQQLWSGSEQGSQLSPESKRGLIAVTELSRKYLDGDTTQLNQLLEILAKFQQGGPEGGKAGDRFTTIWSRFRSLSKQLLQSQ